MAATLSRLRKAYKRGGIRTLAHVIADRLADRVLEMKLGIRTAGLVPIETLLAQWRDCHDYFPTSIRAFRRVMTDLQVNAGDVFVDYGCGMGRTLVLAAAHPFGRVVGIEISADLVGRARTNLASALGAADRGRIELVHADARSFRLPDDATVLYFYNPFHGEILASVFGDIERSLRQRPRRLRLVFNNPVHFERMEAGYPWLDRTREYRFEYSIVVYEARAGAIASAR